MARAKLVLREGTEEEIADCEGLALVVVRGRFCRSINGRLRNGPLTTLGYASCQCVSYLREFVNDQSGAAAIEYGLIAAGISVAIIAVVNGLGTKLNTTFASVSSQLK